MQQLRVGDLCAIVRPLNDGTVMLCNATCTSTIARLHVSDMVMVCSVPRMTKAMRSSLVSLCEVVSLTGEHFIVEVIVASGRHAGSVGFIPSFWLRTEVEATTR